MMNLSDNNDYRKWLELIKAKIKNAQIKAAVKVNSENLTLYWDLGLEISEKQNQFGWGKSVVEQLAKDLQNDFPGLTGFSSRNLYYIQKWYLFYQSEKLPQVVAELSKATELQELKPIEHIKSLLFLVPWGHNREIITKCSDLKEAIFYLAETINNSWSRSILIHQIESNLYKRQGKAITNFSLTLPKPQSDLANETLKNPYNFDFLTIGKQAQERDLENALVTHITKFLLELGKGFAFVGRQYHLEVGDEDFYIDLLFYHLELRCYVVIELKADKFKPEFAGKLNFYLSAVDDILKKEQDNPTIGILICKQKNKVLAEYALRDINKPIGISEYRLTESIPENIKGELPSIEELEKELESTDE